MTEFDLSIFKHQNDECTNCIKCTPINRLLSALKYYSMLDIVNNTKHQDIFNDFINNIYGQQLINDYIHLINEHAQDLEEIHSSIINNKMFSKCNIKTCHFTSRHESEKDNDGNKKNALDPVLDFYKQTMDGLHFYLFHCFDAGLRTKKADNNDNDTDDEEGKGDKYFDVEFNRINKMISERKHITNSFGRFKSNKFNIITTPHNNDNDGNSTTFLDEMYSHLASVGVPNNYIKKLKYFIMNQQYETDSLQYDVLNDDDDDNNGNIEQYISNKRCIGSIKEFIKATKSYYLCIYFLNLFIFFFLYKYSVSSSSFSIGLRFYYWDYYKSIKELADDQQDHTTNTAHSGYNIDALYVPPKYGSFKEEIGNYKDIDFKQYEAVKIKATKYENTPIVKATKAAVADWVGNIALHYDISDGDRLGFPNLISLIMYTDYTDLSSNFSSTFRKKSPFETLQGIKKRNADYYWFSKTLRETVEIFGQCSTGFGNGVLTGSFFCGMSFVMNIPEFNIFLCSPTSTSKQIEVAIKFSGDQGIVIQLDNPQISQYGWLRGFNCSWVSRYKEEDERYSFII